MKTCNIHDGLHNKACKITCVASHLQSQKYLYVNDTLLSFFAAHIGNNDSSSNVWSQKFRPNVGLLFGSPAHPCTVHPQEELPCASLMDKATKILPCVKLIKDIFYPSSLPFGLLELHCTCTNHMCTCI